LTANAVRTCQKFGGRTLSRALAPPSLRPFFANSAMMLFAGESRWPTHRDKS
jgi:hypothetical protein